MRALDTILHEQEEEKEKIPQTFVDDDLKIAFPKDTMSVIEKTIKKESGDLDTNWKDSIDLVKYVFEYLEIPLPTANLINRWEQYKQLITFAVSKLYDSRGMNSIT